VSTHDGGTKPGPSEDDITEAQRLQVLHRKSAAQDACLWCREAWPCRHRQWSEEVLGVAGTDGERECNG
jgi:hypothetical protein